MLSQISTVEQNEKVKEFILYHSISNKVKKNKIKLPSSVFKPAADHVFFLKSVFEGRPPTAFFPYMKVVGIKRDSDRIRKYRREDLEYLFMSFKIRESTTIYNTVVNVFKNSGFIMIDQGENFNCYWSGYAKVEEVAQMNKFQKINHFPNSIQMGRKDLLWKHMYKY